MQSEQVSKIQILPEHIIDQIKAGEVIERPSTLLKELLENSIDAGAKKISIELINNGMDLLVVKDNGAGMSSNDLELAFLRHATSKIERFEDIYNLHSYGFRGEALASMASVSRITCISNKENSPKCTIKINGAQIESIDEDKKKSDQSQTEIFIKDLFYNTPARLKFVKSKTAERNQLQKIINAFLLTHPNVEFNIKWEEKAKRVYPACEHLKRIQDVTQKNFQKLNYIELSQNYDGIKVKLFLSLESSRGAAGKYHFIFVNNRVIQNIQIHKIITNSASRIWGEGLTGHYTLFIELPSDQIDVNVHPNKTVIKFFEAHKVHSLISATIKSYAAESKEKNSQSHENSAPLLSQDFASEMKEKSLQYNQSDFNNPSGLQDYFDKLDQKSEMTILAESDFNYKTILDFEKIFVLKIEDKYYIVHKHNMIKNHFINLVELKVQTIPLLISQPFQIKKLNKKLIEELENYGFELDNIEKNYLVLRSIPESFKDINYKAFLTSLFETNQANFASSLNKINDFSNFMDKSSLIKIIKNSSLSDLIRSSSLRLLTEKDLLDVF